MNFAPDLAQKVIDGHKTVTRRMPSDNPRSPWSREGCGFEVGKDYAVCPGRGKHQIGRVRIISARLEELVKVERRPEWNLEGFATLTGFRRKWEELHGSYEPLRIVWRLQFAVVRDG
jgi:hypothetical protein